MLDQAAWEIVNTAKHTGRRGNAAQFRCPRAARMLGAAARQHVDKKSREQFEMRTHKRVMEILDPTAQTVDALMKLDLAAGVDVEIKF